MCLVFNITSDNWVLPYCNIVVDSNYLSVQCKWYQGCKLAGYLPKLVTHSAVNGEHTTRNLATRSVGNMLPPIVTSFIEDFYIEVVFGIGNASAASVNDEGLGNSSAGLGENIGTFKNIDIVFIKAVEPAEKECQWLRLRF